LFAAEKTAEARASTHAAKNHNKFRSYRTTEQAGSLRKYKGSGVVRPEQFLTQIEPITSAVDAYCAFDRHEAGWIKVKLDPAEQQKRAA